MSFDDKMKIICIVLLVVCTGAYHISKRMPVYLKYKEQKVGVRTKWWRR